MMVCFCKKNAVEILIGSEIEVSFNISKAKLKPFVYVRDKLSIALTTKERKPLKY